MIEDIDDTVYIPVKLSQHFETISVLFPCVAKYFFNRFGLKVESEKYCAKTTERSQACGHYDVPARPFSQRSL